MANAFGRVNVAITASTGGLSTGLQRASRQLDTFGQNVRAIRGRLGALVAIQGAQLFGSIINSAIQATRSLIAMGQAEAQTIDRTAKLARQLGMTFEQLSGLSLAANLSGTSMEEVGRAALLADRRFVEARQGVASAARAFELAGVNINDLAGLDSTERFQALAVAIGNLPTSAERAAAAMQIFGRSGANLLNLFENGAAVIQQSIEDARAFGLALTDVQASNVEAMNDSFERAGGSITGIIRQVTAYLAPAITGIVNTFTEFVGSVGGANIGQSVGLAILDAAVYLAGVADYIVQTAGPVLRSVFEMGSFVADAFFRVAEFFRGVFNAIQVGLASIVVAFTGLFELAANALGFATPALSAFNQEMISGIVQNTDEMAQAFENAFVNGIEGALPQVVDTPFADFMKARRDEAIAAANAINEAVEAARPQVEAAVTINSDALRAIVVGSSEGEAFRNALLRGADPRAQNAVDQQIAQNTAQTAQGIAALPGAIGSAVAGQIAGVSIGV